MRGANASDLGKDLGRRLAILRESRDLTQSQLARKARVNRGSLSQYEAGKKIPDLATLFRLLEALDYGLAALDRADELCVALRLTPKCRPSFGIADPLRAQVASLAAEAGSAVSRLTDAVALLSGLGRFLEAFDLAEVVQEIVPEAQPEARLALRIDMRLRLLESGDGRIEFAPLLKGPWTS